jgi:hypothetical protein
MKPVLLSQLLYSSLYTVQEMKSRRMRWVVHVALGWRRKVLAGYVVEN